jgi:hypothetical protein
LGQASNSREALVALLGGALFGSHKVSWSLKSSILR